MLHHLCIKVAYMPSTFADRLAQALADSGKDRSELASVLRSPKGQLGISASAIGQLLDGKSKSMTAENCARAARFLSVNQYWLATGDGPRLESPVATDTPAHEPPGQYLTPDQVLGQFGDLLARVPESIRSSVADVLHAWAKAGGSAGDDDRRQALAALLQVRSSSQHHGAPSQKQAPSRQ